MKHTNDHNLPETIANAMLKQQAEYNAGEVDSSVTSLIQPARISLLRKLHYRDIVRDLSEEFYALLGSGVHAILEAGKTPDMTVEERLFLDIDGWKISGAIDVQAVRIDGIDVKDYKVTSTYSVTQDEVKPEWVAQLNLYALLIEANKPQRVKSLEIVAILRDWKSSDAKRDPMYPQAPIVVVPIPLWSKHKQLEYARERIASHRQARFDHDMGNEVEFCTNEDRWVRNERWAVMKAGGKRAIKTYNNPVEAQELVEAKGTGYVVDYRPGRSTRCEYCAVSQFCNQYRDYISKEEADDPNVPAEG